MKTRRIFSYMVRIKKRRTGSNIAGEAISAKNCSSDRPLDADRLRSILYTGRNNLFFITFVDHFRE